MTPFKISVLAFSILNVLLLIISFIVEDIFLLFFLICVIELLADLLLLISPRYRSVGQGMLVASMIGLVIGYSVCSNMGLR